jgi:hypothetical protein
MTRPTVVLLHGLARTHRSLAGLRRHLEAQGYPTWSRTYPSRSQPIEALADQVAGWIEADLAGHELVCVTHSLGGILVRHIGERAPFRRICMLAPPNTGSQVAEHVRRLPMFRWFFGPAGRQVASADAWPLPVAPTAVIAGTAGATLSNLPSLLVRGLGIFDPGEPHDGTVSVAETRLPDLADFATVPASHTWIMNHPETRALVGRFLEAGRFHAG